MCQIVQEDELHYAEKQKMGITRKIAPKHILFNYLDIVYDKKTNIPTIKTERISAISGFVNIDYHLE